MAIKFRKKIILAKKETAYGTDATPTGAANAILAKNIDITPLNAANIVSRDLLKPHLGADEQIHVGVHVLMTFEVEFAGAGAAGTVPGYSPLLMACGFAETIAAGTSVTYNLVSDSFDSATLYLHFDGQKHVMLGSRGNVTIAVDTSGIPVYQFAFTGLWANPASVGDPTPDFSAFQIPRAVTNVNTPTFTLHGTSPNTQSINVDAGQQVTYRNVIGEESVQIVGRQGAGSVVIEAPTLSTKNWFVDSKANTTGAMQLVHGTAAGHIVQVDAPKVQTLNPRYGETDGIATLTMDLSLIPSDTGNDELSVVVK